MTDGAKGLGEMTTLPTTPAILNAIYDAVGVRLERLPATAERVHSALQSRGRQAVLAGEKRPSGTKRAAL